MAVPKSKISRSRRGNRRAHDSLSKVVYAECSNCGENKLSHQICPSCGYYNEREVTNLESS